MSQNIFYDPSKVWMKEAPAELKEQKLEFDFEIKADEAEEGVFTGYASTFGNKDLDHDIIERGAFKSSIEKLGAKGVKMLWQHDRREPIGIWEEIKEDKKGIYVRGRLATKTTRGSDAYELMKIGALDKMSIGFMIKTYEIDRKKGVRIIKEGELFEISVVTFPANPKAKVGRVKEEDSQDFEVAAIDAEWDSEKAETVEGLLIVNDGKVIPKALFKEAGIYLKNMLLGNTINLSSKEIFEKYYEQLDIKSPFEFNTMEGFRAAIQAYFAACDTEKDFEKALRDAGLSRKEAKTVMSVKRSQRDVEECDVSNALKRLNASFNK